MLNLISCTSPNSTILKHDTYFLYAVNMNKIFRPDNDLWVNNNYCLYLSVNRGTVIARNLIKEFDNFVWHIKTIRRIEEIIQKNNAK